MASENLTTRIQFGTLETSLTRLSRRAWSNRRAWNEFADRTAISKPQSFAEAISRIRKNLHYFRINYTLIVAFVFAISLISHPLSLLMLIFVIGAWIFLYILRPKDQAVVVFGRRYSDFEVLIGLIVVTILVIVVTNVVSVIFSALGLGMVVVAVHGACCSPQDLFLDDKDIGPSTGPFSFVNNVIGPDSSSLGFPVGPSAV